MLQPLPFWHGLWKAGQANLPALCIMQLPQGARELGRQFYFLSHRLAAMIARACLMPPLSRWN
jgi:hypothetical protein